MHSNHLHYWLAAIYLPEIGPRKILRWLEQFNNIEQLFLAKHAELQAVGLNPKQIAAIKNPDWKSVERDLTWAKKANQHILSLTHPDYPKLLKEIAAPPLVLFVHGHVEALKRMQLAIVGARNASVAGLKNAEQFAYHLAQVGLAITSGLAVGIDGASHRGALRAQGVTIGVAATGLQHIYPSSHRKLAEEIVENNGAVISEFPLTMLPIANNFPRRNRIISGLSVGVLVVEAALKSGSLITVKYALEQGREIFAIPGSIHHPLARGCHHLIRQGAKLVETAKDILEELGGFKTAMDAELSAQFCHLNQPTAAICPKFRQILEQIGQEITSIDMIILQSGLTPGEVSSILLKLELNGYIQSVAGGYIRTLP